MYFNVKALVKKERLIISMIPSTEEATLQIFREMAWGYI